MGEKEGFIDKWKKDGHAGRAHEREGEEQEANGERVVGEPAREFNAGTNRCTCMQHREVLSYRGWGMLACTHDGERTGGLEAGEMLGGGWEWFRCGYEEGRVGVLGQECLLSRVVRHRVVKEGWKGNWGQDVVKHEDDWQRLAKRWARRGIADDEMGKKSHGETRDVKLAMMIEERDGNEMPGSHSTVVRTLVSGGCRGWNHDATPSHHY